MVLFSVSMNNFSDISGDFEIERIRKNKKIIVFIICLIISTVLWFINALSKDYSTLISYPVKFINPPENQFLSGNPPKNLDLMVRGKGFLLLQHKIFMFSPVTIDISDLIGNSQPDSGGYKVTGRSLTSIVSSQISNDLILAEIKPEHFTLALDSLTTKTIPVEIELDVEFVPQMNLKNKVTTTPDLVEITGPTIVLNDINTLKTKVNITNKLSADFQQKIDLLHPEKTTIVPDQVTINIEVEKYTEKEIKIPIEIMNKPVGVNLKLFPSEVKVFFNVGLSRFDKIKESDFGVSVDYNAIISDVNSLVVTIYKQPEFVQNIRINPERVEFLIETD